jgi:hypothetical protein
MEGYDLISKLDKVKAPPDFEEGVLARLQPERRARARRRTSLRLALAGATAAFLAGYVGVNMFVLDKRAPSAVADAAKRGVVLKSESPAGPEVGERRSNPPIQVLEKFDYSQEFRNVSYEPRTVYILEQVSEGTPPGITF